MKTLDVSVSSTSKKSTLQSSRYLYHAQNISVFFGQEKALNAVNFTIAPGEIVFVTGASGAGKTTLLNILAGEIRPNSGKLKCYGIAGKRNIFCARVFQEGRLLENLSIEDNLFLAHDYSLYKNKDEFIHDMYELCQYLGIKDDLHKKVVQANGGMKQKVSMIRALLSKPDVIMADEPTGSLDRGSAFRIFELLNFYNAKKKLTVIWATHNRELVKQFTGKMMHLENGKIVYTGHACFI